MTPSVSTFEVLAEYQGVSLPPARIVEAATGYGTLYDQIVEMRSVPFAFLESVIEPAAALQWLENGGKS